MIFLAALVSVYTADSFALIFYSLFSVVLDGGNEAHFFEEARSVFMESWYYFATYGAALSLFAVAIIGWPLYLFARRYMQMKIYTYIAGGMMVPLASWMILWGLGWNFPSFLSLTGLIVFFSLAFCGAIGGTMFFWSLNVLFRGVLDQSHT